MADRDDIAQLAHNRRQAGKQKRRDQLEADGLEQDSLTADPGGNVRLSRARVMPRKRRHYAIGRYFLAGARLSTGGSDLM
ncbi:MAG: hypothetical protein WDN48_11605 [Pseudolabrys sp.]